MVLVALTGIAFLWDNMMYVIVIRDTMVPNATYVRHNYQKTHASEKLVDLSPITSAVNRFIAEHASMVVYATNRPFVYAKEDLKEITVKLGNHYHAFQINAVLFVRDLFWIAENAKTQISFAIIMYTNARTV